jgi:hypothetical protein
MARRVSPPKATAGEGFNFEDYVVAHFLILLLNQKSPFSQDFGYVTRLDFQTETLGWFLDDLLVTLKSHNQTKRWAISIRSSPQFTAKSAPPDFTRAIWSQFLSSERPNPGFEIGRDLLGLATAPHGTSVWASVQGLLAKARAQHAEDLPGRLEQPGYAKDQADLLASMQCPSDLPGAETFSNDDTARLVSSVAIEQFDFLESPSKDRRMALEYCRLALRSESPDDAESLWKDLVLIARSARAQNGFFDLPKLAAQLRDSHDLKAFPRHAADWSAINEWTTKRLGLIRKCIGQSVDLTRQKELTCPKILVQVL